MAQFDHGNITGCKTVNWGCGLLFDHVYNAVFEFCEIQFNNGTNCILISAGNVSSIRCMSLRSNVCTGQADAIGLFYANVPMTVRDSVITGNTYTYFVHAISRLTFVNCHLDSFTLAGRRLGRGLLRHPRRPCDTDIRRLDDCEPDSHSDIPRRGDGDARLRKDADSRDFFVLLLWILPSSGTSVFSTDVREQVH
jgi:hypothetical protein